MEDKKKKNAKKTARYPDKKGINLIQNEEKKKHLLLTILIAALVVILLELGIKYGVLDLYSKLNAAEEEYDNVHIRYVAAQNQLRDYDDVLMEYRTYSMDWMEKDTSGKYVSVDRKDVLDLIESKMMRSGRVNSLNVSGMTVNVEMSGLNLRQISQMCAELETSPIVESAILMSAGTDEKAEAAVEETGETGETGVSSGNVLTFKILIRLRTPQEKEEG